jgi:flagellin-like hook-associated protein FlgL
LDNINAGTEAMDKIATALASIYEILTEMKSLTSSAQLASATDDDVAAYQASFTDYLSDITTLSDQVTVAGDTVMDGTTDSVTIQVGIATASYREFDYVDTSLDALGLDSADLSIETSTDALAAYSTVDDAINSTVFRSYNDGNDSSIIFDKVIVSFFCNKNEVSLFILFVNIAEVSEIFNLKLEEESI